MESRIEVVKTASFTGHSDCIYVLERSQDLDHFFSAGGDGMIVRWQLDKPDQGELFARVNNSVYALYYIPQENYLLVGENFEGIHLIDCKDRKVVKSVKLTNSYIFDIKVIGNLVYVATGDGYIVILENFALTTVAKIQLSEKSARTIAANPVLGNYAVGFSDHSMQVLSIEKNSLLYKINGHQNSIFTLCYSPDNQYLYSGSRDAHLNIWDSTNNYRLSQSIVAHMFAINHIAFQPKGDYFATCSMDKSVKIWDRASGRLLKVVDRARHAGHATSVNKLLWIDNNLLLSAGDDRVISAWNIKTKY